MSLPKNLLELPHAEFLAAVRKERKLHEKTMIDCRQKSAKFKQEIHDDYAALRANNVRLADMLKA
tara:strand:- start:12 stop:206 length:195 start_codon:yes stop_codon:yes gene_type:complete